MLHAAITSKSDEGEVDDALVTETTSLVEGNKTGKVQKNNKMAVKDSFASFHSTNSILSFGQRLSIFRFHGNVSNSEFE